jgi:endonuclease YncB( thermonuclease family)
MVGPMRFFIAALVFILVSPVRAEPIAPADISISDGDTIKARGKTYRLVGFDTPEIEDAKCAIERQLGAQAMARLQAIIAKGNLSLTEVTCSCVSGTHGTRPLQPWSAVRHADGEG